MAGPYFKKKELEKEIEKKKEALAKRVKLEELSNPEIVSLSQELDDLIVLFQKKLLENPKRY